MMQFANCNYKPKVKALVLLLIVATGMMSAIAQIEDDLEENLAFSPAFPEMVVQSSINHRYLIRADPDPSVRDGENGLIAEDVLSDFGLDNYDMYVYQWKNGGYEPLWAKTINSDFPLAFALDDSNGMVAAIGRHFVFKLVVKIRLYSNKGDQLAEIDLDPILQQLSKTKHNQSKKITLCWSAEHYLQDSMLYLITKDNEWLKFDIHSGKIYRTEEPAWETFSIECKD